VVVDLDAEQGRPASIAIPDLLDDSILLNSPFGLLLGLSGAVLLVSWQAGGHRR
jgi:hypothetical protein